VVAYIFHAYICHFVSALKFRVKQSGAST